MVTEVKEMVPFALQFGEDIEGVLTTEEGHSYDTELQLRVWDSTDEPVYKVTEQPDGALRMMSPTNRYTRFHTRRIIDGVTYKDTIND